MRQDDLSPKDDDLRPEYDASVLKGGVRGKFAGMRRPLVPHAPRRWRRAVGFHSPRMVRLLRMSNSANLSKEGLPHAWPLDKR